jgi:hypothetical protein
MNRNIFVATILLGSIVCGACGGTDTAPRGMGTLVVQLTDAPFPTDSVKSVDIFVVRVDGRVEDVDEATADQNVATEDGVGRRRLEDARHAEREHQLARSCKTASCRRSAKPRSPPRPIVDSAW